MSTLYRNVVITASQSSDGETPSIVSVEPFQQDFLVLIETPGRRAIFTANTSRERAIEVAVRLAEECGKKSLPDRIDFLREMQECGVPFLRGI